MPTLEEYRERKRKWVEALRSGKYKQGKDYLMQIDNLGDTLFCCLGVACDLIPEVEWVSQDRLCIDGPVAFYAFSADSFQVMPEVAREYYGLSDDEGKMRGRTLANLNDIGFSFVEIAGIIESHPPGLFIWEDNNV